MSTELRDRAQRTADEVRTRLSDPADVVARCGVPGGTEADLRLLEPLWDDLSLAGGYPGAALLWSSPGTRVPVAPGRVHAFLSAGSVQLSRPGAASAVRPQGLYAGVGAMAFAALSAHQAGLGYEKAVGRLDELVRAQVRHVVRGCEEEHFARPADFDLTRGLSGTGRLLLARGEDFEEDLRLVLRTLVRRTEPIDHAGMSVPGLWALGGPRPGPPVDAYRGGHLNLGLAHGIAGPLALLSLSHRHGVVVQGHEEAIERLVDVLLAFAKEDAHGVYWPRLLTLDDWRRGAAREDRSRPSWCYGVPGVTRALQLAALALGRPSWQALAHDSLLSLLTLPLDEFGIADAALCHGWAGMLHLLRVCNSDLGDLRLSRFEDQLAEKALDSFDPEFAFGFRTALLNAPRGADKPGYLDGACGIVLALESYAAGDAAIRGVGGAPANWDAALLIS